MTTLRPTLEAVLLVRGDEGVSMTELTKVLQLKRASLTAAVQQLQTRYANDPECGMQIQTFAENRLRLVAKAQYCQQLVKLHAAPKPTALTRPAYEVLAILAHKGEVTRRQIEQIRGINSDGVVQKLVLKKLIQPSRRSEQAGRPWLYKLTAEFYKGFNLNSLKDLQTPVASEVKTHDHNLYEN